MVAESERAFSPLLIHGPNLLTNLLTDDPLRGVIPRYE